MDKKYEIKDLSLDEINLILSALADRPYAQVYSLIDKISKQGKEQFDKKPQGK